MNKHFFSEFTNAIWKQPGQVASGLVFLREIEDNTSVCESVSFLINDKIRTLAFIALHNQSPDNIFNPICHNYPFINLYLSQDTSL